jgi:hypothetical protein
MRKDLPKPSPSSNAKSMRDIPFVWDPITNPDRTTDIVAHYDAPTYDRKVEIDFMLIFY